MNTTDFFVPFAAANGITFSILPPPPLRLGNGAGYSLYAEDRAGMRYCALQNVMGAARKFALRLALRCSPGWVTAA